MTYSQKLKDPRWQKKRLEILNRDEFTCQICKDTKTELHVHHVEYKGEPWQQDNDKLVTLCKHCHEVITYLGLQPYDIKGAFKKKTSDNRGFTLNIATHESDKIYCFWFSDNSKELSILSSSFVEQCYNLLK